MLLKEKTFNLAIDKFQTNDTKRELEQVFEESLEQFLKVFANFKATGFIVGENTTLGLNLIDSFSSDSFET